MNQMSQTENNSKENTTKSPERRFTIYPSDFWKGFQKLWWLCVLLAVLLGGGMFFRSYKNYSPRYTASASFTVSTQTNSASIGGISVYSFYYDSTTAAQLASTFPYLLNSNLLSDMICEDMGLTSVPASMSASAVTGSNMFTLSVTGKDPQMTYDILQSVIENYPSVAKYVVGNIKLTMITSPVVPEKPSNAASYRDDAFKGAAAGLAVGLLIIIAYAISRRTVRTKENIRNELNADYLGTVPQVRFKKHKTPSDRSVLFTNDKVGAGFLESIRILRNKFSHALKDGEKIIMVTSTAPGEGKTTVLANLAIALADYDKRVLLIDADLRNPSVAKLLRLNLDELNYYTQTDKYKIAKLEDYNISFMTIDNSDLKKQRFINTDEVKRIFDDVRDSYDYILVDAPPCGLVSDALYIAQEADAVFYVIYQDAVRIPKIRSGLDGLMSTDVRIMGCVINGAMSGMSGYGYDYGYGYASAYGYYGSRGGYAGYGYSYGGETDSDSSGDEEHTDKKKKQRRSGRRKKDAENEEI